MDHPTSTVLPLMEVVSSGAAIVADRQRMFGRIHESECVIEFLRPLAQGHPQSERGQNRLDGHHSILMASRVPTELESGPESLGRDAPWI